ncbi:hypothetical protein LCGC14_1410730 [marine sediment metagenome]|uniref:Glycosyl transferase family 1 domain-containing protein n=1 Tax=marine sediment metagenome TaxID=412755 RepID=A0A0F9JUP6_9ZZZZ
MSNILFIGNYRSAGGWAEACINYIHALSTTKHNITIRPVYMDSTHTEYIDPRLLMLEQNRYDKYDIIIQKVLPNILEFTVPAKRNIHLCVFETANLKYTGWPRYINFMDELWVPSEQEKLDRVNDKINIPINIVKEPIDTDKFTYEYDQTNWRKFGLHDNFVFYFIGEYIPRKNIKALLTAFHREFSTNEPVDLLIKTNKGNMDMRKLASQIDQDLAKIKQTYVYIII